LQDLIRFEPPEVIFAFQYGMFFLLYSPPNVELTITFEFTVTLKVGFNLDTKGIREAVEQGKPEKVLNSFALMDTFDGVDEAMITMTASIIIAVDVSAVIVKVGVSGAITFRVKVDLFDPFPETSKGLIRPFELLSIGSGPLDWFTFSLEIWITIKLYIKIGFYAGFVEVTLWKYEKSFQFNIIDPLIFTPKKPTPPVELSNGSLKLLSAGSSASSSTQLECTGLDGTMGDETIECSYGIVFASYSGVKSIVAATSGDYYLRAIKSEVNLSGYAVGVATLDYRSAGVDVIANNMITIKEKEILLGDFNMKFASIGSGILLLPEPEQAGLMTYVGGQCDSTWHLEGHSNLYINANEIKPDCVIEPTGGTATTAIFTVDFGFDKAESKSKYEECQDGNRVELRTLGEGMQVVIIRNDGKASPVTFTYTLPPVFTNFIIKMTKCKDEVILEDTQKVIGSVSISTGGENDIIKLGNAEDGLNSIYMPVTIYGGDGDDRLVVDDSASSLGKRNGFLTAGSIFGLLNGALLADIDYTDIEILDIKLSRGENEFEVQSTAQDMMVNIIGQDGNDDIYIQETQGNIQVYAGGGDDTFYLYGLGKDVTASFYGEEGNDKIWIDGTNHSATSPPVNFFEGSILRWSGGPGDDTMHITLSAVGTSNINIFEDFEGINDVNIDCANLTTVMLSRENFLANIHNTSDQKSTVERINLEDTATINTIFIRLNGGENEMYFDDTFAPMDVYGGSGVDREYAVCQFSLLLSCSPILY
jgi:hypothetical protein